MGNCDSSPDDVYDSRRGRWYSGRQPWQSHTQRHQIGGMHRGDPMMMPPSYGGFQQERMFSSGGMPPSGYSRFGGGDMYGGPYGGKW